jgi:hypothetical protein
LGSFEDLKQANILAKRMIGNFGMGEKMEVFFNEDIGDESNPFVGRSIALGDKYSFGKWGRRKLYIAIGFIGQALSIFFLFRPELFINTDPIFSNGVSVANSTVVNWYFAFQIIYNISNALILVPYQSWLIESAADNSDYLKSSHVVGFKI